MRKEKRGAMTREIWRQRLRGIRVWSAIAFVLFLGFVAYVFDPPISVAHEIGSFFHQRHSQSDIWGSRPYLVVERPDGIIATVRISRMRTYEDGEEICILIARGSIFGRLSATPSDKKECSP